MLINQEERCFTLFHAKTGQNLQYFSWYAIGRNERWPGVCLLHLLSRGTEGQSCLWMGSNTCNQSCPDPLSCPYHLQPSVMFILR